MAAALMSPRAAARARVLDEARDWLGTPYRHQASQKGAGTDCLGLIRGVWRAVEGPEPETPPPYTPDWAERAGAETLHEAACRWLVPLPTPEAAGDGDVLLFRMHHGAPMKHAAVLDKTRMLLIHAYWGRAVIESRLTPYWRDRLAAAFAFPCVSRAWARTGDGD